MRTDATTAEIVEILTAAGITCRGWTPENTSVSARVYVTNWPGASARSVRDLAKKERRFCYFDADGTVVVDVPGEHGFSYGTHGPELPIMAALTAAGVACR